jgi:N-acylneuraminate cytidylyltransferase
VIGGRSVLALITARGGSKGLPGKNILRVGGRPLIQWTIDAARGSRYIDRLVLSSDDAAIIAAAKDGGCEVPFVRAAALATDEAASVDVVADALQRVPGYDLIVLLQPTSPLRSSGDIDGAIELLVSSGAPACVSVREAHEHPYWSFGLDEHGTLVPFAAAPSGDSLRRQDLPPAWCLNGAVFVARIPWFVSARTFLCQQTVGFQMPVERSLDIDTPADIESLQRAVAAAQDASRAVRATKQS